MVAGQGNDTFYGGEGPGPAANTYAFTGDSSGSVTIYGNDDPTQARGLLDFSEEDQGVNVHAPGLSTASQDVAGGGASL